MDPKTFADRMRQARLNSPLRTREQALKQFAEVEAFLARQNLLPVAMEGARMRLQCLRISRSCQSVLLLWMLLLGGAVAESADSNPEGVAIASAAIAIGGQQDELKKYFLRDLDAIQSGRLLGDVIDQLVTQASAEARWKSEVAPQIVLQVDGAARSCVIPRVALPHPTYVLLGEGLRYAAELCGCKVEVTPEMVRIFHAEVSVKPSNPSELRRIRGASIRERLDKCTIAHLSLRNATFIEAISTLGKTMLDGSGEKMPSLVFQGDFGRYSSSSTMSLELEKIGALECLHYMVDLDQLNCEIDDHALVFAPVTSRCGEVLSMSYRLKDDFEGVARKAMQMKLQIPDPLRDWSTQEGRANLSLSKATLSFDVGSNRTDAFLWLEDYLSSEGLLNQPRTPPRPKRAEVLRRLDGLILPSVQFRNLLLPEAFDELTKAIETACAVEKVAPPILQLELLEGVDLVPLSLDLHDIPATEALRYLAIIGPGYEVQAARGTITIQSWFRRPKAP